MGRAETRFALGLLGFKLCAQLPAWKKKRAAAFGESIRVKVVRAISKEKATISASKGLSCT